MFNPSPHHLREEICRVGRSLFERGYVHATAGNISARWVQGGSSGFFITPTDACLGQLEPSHLAELDDQGRQTGGDPASKTWALHQQIYQASANTGAPAACIIHTHSSHCVALTLRPTPPSDAPELLPPLTPYFVMKVGHVPLLGYHRPGDPAAAQEVADAIQRYQAQGTPIRAVMLPRLGPNVWHRSPAAAMATLEELEETARLVVLNPGPLAPLGEAQIEELRQRFSAVW